MPRPGSARSLPVLFALYFAQGLPFGFQATALPVYLRVSGVSLAAIGLAGALALPWMLKVLWAPLVDRFGSARFGRRRSWIVPLQLLLAITCAAAALVPPERGLGVLLGLVFVMNLFAATQDIATDGLAVDLLGERDLGPANAAQVVGYKAGMLTGGGLLVWASDAIGWPGLFAAMAVLLFGVALVALTVREAPAAGGREAPPTVGEIVAAAVAAIRAPGAPLLLAVIATYKLGESMVDGMFKPFLVDAGVSPARIGLWLGTYGMAASLVGSLAGGWLATRVPLLAAVAIASALRSAGLGAESYLAAAGSPTAAAIVAVTAAEHLAGGALTTAMFALMMSRVDRSIGATHFTLLASVEVLGKAPGRWLSGVLAERIGYAWTFAAGTALSLAFLLLLARYARYWRTIRPGVTGAP